MASTEPRTRFQDVDGVRIAYWDAGEGRPVVFVHGNFASKRWFRAQFEDESAEERADRATAPQGNPLAGWRFIAPDLPNFGESGPLDATAPQGSSTAQPVEITMDRYADALAGLLDALRLERVVLVGHSLGGAVVQTFAVARPERVAGLFLMSSPPPSGFVTPPGTEEAQRALHDDPAQMAAALAATMPTRQPEDFDRIVDDAGGVRVDLHGPHNRALATMDLTARTERVTCPVLVLRCERDYLIGEAMAREAAEAYPNARLVLWDGIGHSPQVEDPSRFRALLAEFLEGVAMT